MTLNISADTTFFGPALPEAFVQHELEGVLGKALPSAKEVDAIWRSLHKALPEPLTNAGPIRVRNMVVNPWAQGLGYDDLVSADQVRTREGLEDGGWMLPSAKGKLRLWSYEYETDLDASTKRGLNHRFSPTRVAERMLLATGERLGLLTNGVELRLIFSDPARRASFASFSLSQWKQVKHYDPIPDAFRLFVAFTRPEGQAILPKVIEEARLKQGQVTKDLRSQARKAIEGFIQGVLDNPANAEKLNQVADKGDLSRELWRESLIMVYRLLFILRGESGGRETPPFSFASSSLWRNTYSPSRAQPGNLAWMAQKVREEGIQSGSFIEDGLRAMFRMFAGGLDATELHIAPLGGALFGAQSTPLLNRLKWGEAGCALLLDNLLRAPRGKGKGRALMRLSYRDLDVEELGRVYEALLELEPGIASEPMARLRRSKLEVVVPAAQGEKYRPKEEAAIGSEEAREDAEEQDDTEEAESDEESESSKKSKIEFIETIKPNQFYLRVGLGRKSSGSYYTPESFVKFLVQETLGVQCDALSPADDPRPLEILSLNVLDPAMGSGHFLVGACRYLGERLYDACRAAAEKDLWERVPGEVAPYLPGRRPEGERESGFSAERAKALCKRLVAVHCLYGVDKNPLAVELAKVSLWLESFAEGLPLTFLDHRLVCGDSLLGVMNLSDEGKDSPFTPPYVDTPMDAALMAQARDALRGRLGVALEKVRALDATVGVDEADLLAKQHAKAELDAALRPFVDLCVAWSGGVMLGAGKVDAGAYQQAMELVANNKLPEIEDALLSTPENWVVDEKGLVRLTADTAVPAGFLTMLSKGRTASALVIPLVFPEVFFPKGNVNALEGFDTVLGNPPWDAILFKTREFFASFDFEIMNAPTKRERLEIENRLTLDPNVGSLFSRYKEAIEEQKRVNDTLYEYQKVYIEGDLAGRQIDAYRVFMERNSQLLRSFGLTGIVVPSAFHASEGATGIRRLYLNDLALQSCYSFENKRKLFDIHASFKFAVVLARKGEKTSHFKSRFYLHDDGLLFDSDRLKPITYSRDFVQETGGEYLSFLEAKDIDDVSVIQSCFSHNRFQTVLAKANINFITSEMHTTHDSYLFEPTKDYVEKYQDPRRPEITEELLSQGMVVLHEGKTIHQFDDQWGQSPRYLVSLSKLKERERWLNAIRYYRLGYRSQASATNERTAIFLMIPPTSVCSIKLPSDISPDKHPTYQAPVLCGIGNSFAFDFCLRQMVATDVNLFILSRIPVSSLKNCEAFVVHNALRLSCNHIGYAPLWQEQLGDEWRESVPAGTYPVLAGEEARWEVRSAIDAVVGQAYGLSRKQYAHVLSTFSHKSYPKAPSLCLAKFDKLSALGVEAFVRQYDPYWDVPLVESLPSPVIELPKVDGVQVSERQASYGVKDLFGNPLETDLFGNVVTPSKRHRKRKL
jgi:hypothetical protein